MSVLNSALPIFYYAITQSGIFYVFHYTHSQTWENSQSAELHSNEHRIIIAIFISIQCLNNFSSFSHVVVDNWMSFALLLIQFWLNFALMFCALLNRMSGIPFAPSLPIIQWRGKGKGAIRCGRHSLGVTLPLRKCYTYYKFFYKVLYLISQLNDELKLLRQYSMQYFWCPSWNRVIHVGHWRFLCRPFVQVISSESSV